MAARFRAESGSGVEKKAFSGKRQLALGGGLSIRQNYGFGGAKWEISVGMMVMGAANACRP